MNKVAAVVPTAIQHDGHRDNGRYLTVGCALTAQLAAGERSLRGRRATYYGSIRASATDAR